MLKTRDVRNIVDTRTARMLTLVTIVVAGVAGASIEESIKKLRLDYSALVAAETDFRVQRDLSGLGGEEAADYAAYVAGLQRRVFEGCAVVMSSGADLPVDLPCPESLPVATRSAEIETQTEQSYAEQVAALDAELNVGLGEFDEKLLREQDRIKAAAPNTNDGGGGGGGGGGEGEGSAGSIGGGSDSNIQNGDEGGESGGLEAAGESAGLGGGSGNPVAGQDQDRPADIPDGSDDDIVARQLREAAERETDPELKVKLWEEYRNYKKGTG